MNIPVPLVGVGGRASCAVPGAVLFGRQRGRVGGPGLTVTVVEGSHLPGSVSPAAVVVCGGWMTGRLEVGR